VSGFVCGRLHLSPPACWGSLFFMRIRTIKPEFFMHDGLFEAERAEKLPLRIAFVGLWCAADREGRFKWEPRRLGAQILPFDDVDFSRVLHALATRAFIRHYRVGDACFGVIPSWKRHQVINNRERDSEIPNPSEGEQLDACPTRAPRVTHASKEEGKGREGNKEGKEDIFLEFWEAYPRKVGKSEACKAFSKLPDHARILAAAKAYAAAVATWKHDDKQYVPHPTTWLNRGSYDDDPKTWERTNGTPQPEAPQFDANGEQIW
jgi:hypothetical protein